MVMYVKPWFRVKMKFFWKNFKNILVFYFNPFRGEKNWRMPVKVNYIITTVVTVRV